MSDANPMEQAAGQAVQTAAVALQVLILTARALNEASRRGTAPTAQPTPTAKPTPAPQQMPAHRPADPDHERYEHIVRAVVPPAVAEAMVTAPQWPELAGELKKLEGAGVNVGTFLTDAAPVIARMDTDLKAGGPTPGVIASPTANLRDPWAPPQSQERAQREGPGMVKRIVDWVKQAVAKIVAKITGKEKPTTALGDRSRELARLGISAQENSRLVVVARESLADESVLNQMVLSREWPGIAGQIKALQDAGRDPREALASIPTRLQQAAAAGANLSPAKAARGLLTEQAKSTAPARTTAPSSASTSSAPSTTTPKATTSAEATAAQAPDRAAAASAQSTTATPGAAPAPGPQAARTAPTTQSTPTRTQAR